MIIESGKSTVNGAVVDGVHAHIVEVGCEVRPGTMPGISVVPAPGSSMREARRRNLTEQVRTAFRDMGLHTPRAGVTFTLNGVTTGSIGTDGLALPMAAALLEASGLREESFGEQDVLFGSYADYGMWCTPAGAIAISEETSRTRRDLVLPEGFTRSVDPRCLAGTVKALDGLDPCAPGAVRRSEADGLGMYPEPSPMDVSGLSMDTVVALEAIALRQPVLVSSREEGEAARAARFLESAVNAETRHRDALAELAGSGLSSMIYPEMSLAAIVGGGRPVRPGALSLAGDGVLLIHDIDRFSSSALASISGAWDAVRLVRVDRTVTFRTGFSPVATCEAGHEAAARDALQAICFDHVPYQTTLPFVPDARSVIDDLGKGGAPERGCLASYVAERRAALKENGVESLGVEEAVRSWPEGMEKRPSRTER